MTFKDLYRYLEQTSKARRGVKGKIDYFKDDPDEEFYRAVYKRALAAANAVVKHYEEVGAYDPKDRPKITWRDDKK